MQLALFRWPFLHQDICKLQLADSLQNSSFASLGLANAMATDPEDGPSAGRVRGVFSQTLVSAVDISQSLPGI